MSAILAEIRKGQNVILKLHVEIKDHFANNLITRALVATHLVQIKD
jgi:hypothetical protein